MRKRIGLWHRGRVLSLAVTLCGSVAARSQTLAPDASWILVGKAGHTESLSAGLTWDLPWRGDWNGGRFSTYAEAGIGRWSVDDADGPDQAWVTQMGVTPVLRWSPRGASWFTEAAVGINVIAPLYRGNRKRFATAFNFGDHVAVGRYLDSAARHELSLRLQHFSNAGIKRPNPGENFVQLRYLWRLDR